MKIIIETFFRKNKQDLISHICVDKETEKQYKIKQVETGNIYDEAIDVMPCRYTYEETDELIEKEEEVKEPLEEI